MNNPNNFRRPPAPDNNSGQRQSNTPNMNNRHPNNNYRQNNQRQGYTPQQNTRPPQHQGVPFNNPGTYRNGVQSPPPVPNNRQYRPPVQNINQNPQSNFRPIQPPPNNIGGMNITPPPVATPVQPPDNIQFPDGDPRTQTISNHPVSRNYVNTINSEPADIRAIDRRKNYRVQPADKPEKKIFKKVIILLISLVLIAAILISCVFVGIYSLCAKTNYIEDNLVGEEDFLQMLFTDEPITNILLIGTDNENDDISRSDTMMLVTIDKTNEKIKLTSFMRDMWVDIPGHGEGRLNASYAKGGPELLIKTLNTSFNLDIQHYVLVDFEMFVELIDGLGGVTVEITEKEAEFINRTTSVKVEEGINELNGKEALVYCRIRKLDSDFMRTKRQRKVITAIIEKAKSQEITTTIKVGTSILPLIQTNISPEKMTAKSLHLLPALKYTTEQLRVPVDKGYTEERINGQQVLVPDLKFNSEEINKFIQQ